MGGSDQNSSPGYAVPNMAATKSSLPGDSLSVLRKNDDLRPGI